MSGETASNQEQKLNQQGDTATSQLQEEIEIIKHPPAMEDVLRELPPEELMANQAVVPQTIHEPSDLRDDYKRGE
jgi:hypothetical protein